MPIKLICLSVKGVSMKYRLAKALLAALTVIVATHVHAADAPPAAKTDPAKAQQIATTVCAACHGADGNSAVSVNPTLAGQHMVYVANQLVHFKSGERKNAVMAAIAASLSPDDINNLAAYFVKQAIKPQSASDKALAQLGEKLYRGGNFASGVPACAACHGPNGAGVPIQYPRLGGQYADYTVAQLKAFRSDERVNTVMNGVAAKLSDREIQSVAEYIAGLR
jgi:cytochrome c553